MKDVVRKYFESLAAAAWFSSDPAIFIAYFFAVAVAATALFRGTSPLASVKSTMRDTVEPLAVAAAASCREGEKPSIILET